MTTELRERLEWDPIQGTLRDRDIPYVMIRPDSLMGIFRPKAELTFGQYIKIAQV